MVLVLAAAGILLVLLLGLGRGALERAGDAVRPPEPSATAPAAARPLPRSAAPDDRDVADGGRAALAEPRGDPSRDGGGAGEEAPDPRVLSGTVVDPEGRPVAGARVLRFPVMAAEVDLERPLGEATTDARGAFRFEEGESFGRAQILAHAGGFFPAVARDVLAGRAERLVLGRAQPFSGRVLEEAGRRPLAGVRVQLAMPWRGGGSPFAMETEARTDAQGGYAFPAGRLGGPQGLALEVEGAPPVGAGRGSRSASSRGTPGPPARSAGTPGSSSPPSAPPRWPGPRPTPSTSRRGTTTPSCRTQGAAASSMGSPPGSTSSGSSPTASSSIPPRSTSRARRATR